MKYAILYNIFICWVVAGMGILIARHILALKNADTGDKTFALFWLFSAGLWTFSGFRLLAFHYGYGELDRALFYVVQIFLAFHLVVGALFLCIKSISNLKAVYVIFAVASFLSFLFLFFMFFDGIAQTTTTKWASDHEIPRRALIFFMPVYGFCVVMTVYVIIQRALVGLMRAKLDRRVFFAVLAMLIYELAGIVDVIGRTADYGLLIIRGLYMVSALVAFFSYSWEPSSIRIVTAGESEEK